MHFTFKHSFAQDCLARNQYNFPRPHPVHYEQQAHRDAKRQEGQVVAFLTIVQARLDQTVPPVARAKDEHAPQKPNDDENGL